MIRRTTLFAAALLALTACSPAVGDLRATRVRAAPAKASVPAPAPASAAPPAVLEPTVQTPRAPTQQAWTPFAAVGGVTLLHPSVRVQRVAFHESNHDGARDLSILPTAVAPVTLETRERGTEARTAADVVADPGVEIRAPVSGTVKRAGSYVLYCDNTDNFVVIEPDQHRGWEVKVLHMNGLNVRVGDRVTAGQTVLAPGPRKLPFESQVDEISTGMPWPHVHIEVVDPTIRDRPTPGGGCN